VNTAYILQRLYNIRDLLSRDEPDYKRDQVLHELTAAIYYMEVHRDD